MATSQMRVLSKNKEPRKADALREHSIVKMRQQKSEAKAAQPEEAAGVRLVVQLHGKANQLLQLSASGLERAWPILEIKIRRDDECGMQGAKWMREPTTSTWLQPFSNRQKPLMR